MRVVEMEMEHKRLGFVELEMICDMKTQLFKTDFIKDYFGIECDEYYDKTFYLEVLRDNMVSEEDVVAVENCLDNIMCS